MDIAKEIEQLATILNSISEVSALSEEEKIKIALVLYQTATIKAQLDNIQDRLRQISQDLRDDMSRR